MGYGSWSSDDYVSYATSTGRSTSKTYVTNATTGVTTEHTILSSSYGAQDIFKARGLDPLLDPKNVHRECNDSEEHPNTVPVILALDVTGSMGSAAAEVAKKLNVVMSQLYSQIKDVEFMVMAIGDLDYDRAPIQISQFEADVRVAKWVDKIYFEHGGGGNLFESYTAVWYMGLYHMMLDSWKRGKKGIMITIGDEPLNPYLPKAELARVTGDNLQADVETDALYSKASERFDIYHLAVDDAATAYERYVSDIQSSWGKLLDSEHFRVVTMNDLIPQIVDIVSNAAGTNDNMEFVHAGKEIAW